MGVTLSFEQARATVLREVRACVAAEEIWLADAAGRVLAEDVAADRDYPPFDRSARDGFAVRARDLAADVIPGLKDDGPILRIVGEIRAGEIPSQALGAGQAIEIMTGAPMPEGADAVVMIEHVRRSGSGVLIDRALIKKMPQPGDNFTPRGTEARRGAIVLERGRRVGFAEIALLAMLGRARVPVFARPVVAIVPTGDEIVEIDKQPGDFQIRNSNTWSLAAQVRRAGAIPRVLPIAPDDYGFTRMLIESGLRGADLLLMSGGVSAGKYDIVEKVLADLGAKFFFDRVAIQPGQPVVFGAVGGKFFFGLPGNPVSTMVTFELFARAAIDRLSGCDSAPLPLTRARITRDFRHKPGLTRFLPAVLSEDGSAVTPMEWHGSGDVPAAARANAFLVADADRETWKEGADIRVLLR
jgi:molybdopterin molybdotransferase